MGFRKRRERYSLFFSLPFLFPLADALSLANFQEITSNKIPLACQLAYDAQIPTCQVSDFKEGCSRGCEEALASIANFVSIACAGTSVKSKTLLGIVQDGGIIEALCGTSSQATTAAMTTTTTSSRQVTSAASTSKSTSSSIVVVTTTTQTTTTTSAVPVSSTILSQTSTTSTSSTISTVIASTTTSAPDSVNAGGAVVDTTSSTSTTSKAASSTHTQTNQNGAGNGDPFDVDIASENGADRMLQASKISSLVAVAFTILLLTW
ncbi:hypothetical protein B7463_g7483, partial [Scytalidium lignicola]